MSVYVNNLDIELVPVAGAVTDQTINDTAAVSSPVPADTEFVLVAVSGASVRYREDGQDPAAGAGFLLAADDPPLISSVRRHKARKWIRATGTNGVLHVQALRKP